MLRAPLALLLALLALVVGPGCSPASSEVWSAGPATLERDGPTVLPLLGGPVPIVQGSVDGHPARLLLDTGAEATLLDEAFAARAGLPRRALDNRVTSRRGGEVARVYATATRVGRLELGAAAAGDLQPLLADLAHLGLQLDGIVGMDVLGRWTTLFDDEGQQVHILPTGSLGSALAGTFAEGTAFSAWPWAGTGAAPAVSLVFDNGVEFDVLLDTGAVLGAIPETAVAALGLRAEGTHDSHHVGGSEVVASYRLPRLQLGEVVLLDLVVGACAEPRGLLGYGALRELVFALDGPARLFAFAWQPARR